MRNPVLRLFSRQLRRLPAGLCLLALAMQVSLPALHGPHQAGGGAAFGAPVLLAAARHTADHAGHDSATCSQCRLVSQIRSLAAPSIVASAPAVSADWIVAAAPSDSRSHAERDTGAPRAPPPHA